MINKASLNAVILGFCLVSQTCSAFSTTHSRAIGTPDASSRVQLSASRDDGTAAFLGSRRDWARGALSSFVALGSLAVAGSAPARARAADAGDTVWKTGRAPIVPGQKPKDKTDPKGTRKDPGFLRSISDCKTKCETTPGLAKPAVECLAECQDICCTTYEQCTFAIVPR